MFHGLVTVGDVLDTRNWEKSVPWCLEGFFWGVGGGGNRKKKKGKRDSPAPRCLPKDLIEFRDFPPASFSNSSLLLLGKTRLGVLPELWEEPCFHSVGGLEHMSLLPGQQTSVQIPPTGIAWTLKALLLFKLGFFFPSQYFSFRTAPFPYWVCVPVLPWGGLSLCALGSYGCHHGKVLWCNPFNDCT